MRKSSKGVGKGGREVLNLKKQNKISRRGTRTPQPVKTQGFGGMEESPVEKKKKEKRGKKNPRSGLKEGMATLNG